MTYFPHSPTNPYRMLYSRRSRGIERDIEREEARLARELRRIELGYEPEQEENHDED